jgi:hypothetical protein
MGKDLIRKKPFRESIFFLVLMAGTLFMTLQIHKGKGYFNWQSEIWGDKAGYYIYLPAFFYYHFHLNEFPPKIDEKTGNGFTLDTVSGKMRTKYTCGVAVLVSPFFVAAHYISKIFHISQDWGFSPLYHKMMDFAAVFYLILGLWLLKRFLEHYIRERTAFITVLLVFLGTNLLYYATTESLMSHVFSFFLFSLLLFSVKKFLAAGKKYGWFLLASLAFALIVLVRPFNLIILPFILLWDVDSWKAFKERVKLLFRPHYIVSFLVILFVVLLPQLLYWKYLSGHYIYYSYGQEGFFNWDHPKIPEVWFSTLNGLFLYNPLVLFFVAGIILMIVYRKTNGILLFIQFLILSYMVSSWENWYFGCSYGQRPFVEYYSFLALPFGFLAGILLDRKKRILKSVMLLIMAVFTFYNLAMMRTYERCFFGSVWDWGQYSRQFDKSVLKIPFGQRNIYKVDFENQVNASHYYVVDWISRSGNFSAILYPENWITWEMPDPYGSYNQLQKKIQVDFWLFKIAFTGNSLYVYRNILFQDRVISSIIHQVHVDSLPVACWSEIKDTFTIPDSIPMGSRIKIIIVNGGHTRYFVDDMNFQLE